MYPPYGAIGPYLSTSGYRSPYSVLVSYGSMELTETSPAQSWTEPLTLSEVLSYLHLPATTTEGETIQMFISAARECGEIAQNRDLVRKQWDLSHDYWPGPCIEMRTPLVSVDLVRYRDNNGNYATLAPGTDYIVDASKKPGIITPPWAKPWPIYTPYASSSLLVRFTSGLDINSAFWNDAGARVKIGMKYLISQWFSNRIPFGAKVEEMPYAITSMLGWGAVPRAR